jgi:hypothetical protein
MRFDDEIERRFLREYTAQLANRRRIMMLAALVVSLVYFGIDAFDAMTDNGFFLVPTLLRGNAVPSAPAPRLAGVGTLERPGLHAHAGAWEREQPSYPPRLP